MIKYERHVNDRTYKSSCSYNAGVCWSKKSHSPKNCTKINLYIFTFQFLCNCTVAQTCGLPQQTTTGSTGIKLFRVLTPT